MIISKSEEPFFHNFLSIAKQMIKETGSKNNLIFGEGGKIKFICGDYAGIFAYDTERLDRDYYNFGHDAYEISVLPNDDIKLEKKSFMPCSEYYLETVKKFFGAVDLCSDNILEIKKEDECKIAKILSVTGCCWLKDDTLKYLSKMKYADIYVCTERYYESFKMPILNDFNNEYVAAYQELELDGGQTTLSMTLIFNVRTNPRLSTHSQQKIKFNDVNEETPEEVIIESTTEEHAAESEELNDLVDNIEEEVEEETEDEFDPMLA